MLDNTLLYTLETILEHIEICEKRFAIIKTPSNFIDSENGTIILDSIVTRLQAIGENVKSISKKHPEIIANHNDIDWNNIIRFRDFISHHYEMLDYEIVFHICDYFLPKLKNVIDFELKKFGE
jgi:uncharacterized protein with HEPN domain